jgi:hypothetical protein
VDLLDAMGDRRNCVLVAQGGHQSFAVRVMDDPRHRDRCMDVLRAS